MVVMNSKAMLLSFIVLICFGCNFLGSSSKINYTKDENYPRWLRNTDYRTDQTSGIAFIGRDENKVSTFLLADDLGKIHHLKMENDTSFSFSPVYFTPAIDTFFTDYPKIDFEEIWFDKHTNSVYLSIEGNGKTPLKYTSIFKLNFKDGNIFSDSITAIQKLDINPSEQFYRYIKNNLGFEGAAVDENYFYFGFEGFFENGIFGDSTIMYVVNKKNLQIVKEINTKSLGIHTICGLYSDENYSLFGIDRNNKNLFHLQFDEELEVKNYALNTVLTSIPGYPEYDYVVSIESLTMDDSGNLFLVDDPWRNFFIPPGEILQKLDEKTVQNFKDFVPVIYKLNLKHQ